MRHKILTTIALVSSAMSLVAAPAQAALEGEQIQLNQRGRDCLAISQTIANQFTGDNGTAIISDGACNPNWMAQRFVISKTSVSNTNDRWYVTIRSVYAANKCVDLQNGNLTQGTRLQLWECNGSPAQTFIYDNVHKSLFVNYDNPWTGRRTPVCVSKAASSVDGGVWQMVLKDCPGDGYDPAPTPDEPMYVRMSVPKLSGSSSSSSSNSSSNSSSSSSSGPRWR